MNHNYKITDFKKTEFESETDLRDVKVIVYLRNVLKLPAVLEKRLEKIINNLISECEQANSIEISLEDMELENCITVDTKKNVLMLEVYIGYDIKKELLYYKEDIASDDEHYTVIKEFFFNKLNAYVSTLIHNLVELLEK